MCRWCGVELYTCNLYGLLASVSSINLKHVRRHGKFYTDCAMISGDDDRPTLL